MNNLNNDITIDNLNYLKYTIIKEKYDIHIKIIKYIFNLKNLIFLFVLIFIIIDLLCIISMFKYYDFACKYWYLLILWIILRFLINVTIDYYMNKYIYSKYIIYILYILQILCLIIISMTFIIKYCINKHIHLNIINRNNFLNNCIRVIQTYNISNINCTSISNDCFDLLYESRDLFMNKNYTCN